MLWDATSRSTHLGSMPWTVSWGPHVCSALGLSFFLLSKCAKRPSVRHYCECAATTPCESVAALPQQKYGWCAADNAAETRPVPLPWATPAEPKNNLFPSLAVLPPTYTHARRGRRATPTGAVSPAPQPKHGSSAVPREVGNTVTAWRVSIHCPPSPLCTSPCTPSDSASPPADPLPNKNKPSRSDHDRPGPTSLVQLRLASGDGSAVDDPRPERGDVPGS